MPLGEGVGVAFSALGGRGGRRRGEEARGKGCSPVAVQLLDPVHDEAQAQARRADGQELRLLVLIYRQKLCGRETSKRVRESSCTGATRGRRTKAIQKLKLAGSVGMGT